MSAIVRRRTSQISDPKWMSVRTPIFMVCDRSFRRTDARGRGLLFWAAPIEQERLPGLLLEKRPKNFPCILR